MKRLLLVALTSGLLVAAVAVSQNQASKDAPPGDLQIQVEGRNPWTNLRLNNDPADFRFAVVSDRTGGHRAKVFSQAVEKLNLMQPEFVLSVGDLIEGYKDDPAKLADEWREMQGYVSKLQMPFFYLPGNHDVANAAEAKVWQERFGRTYYHFVYRNVLFLLLNSNDPNERAAKQLSAEQIAYVKKALTQNADVRWTFVLTHNPIWLGDVEKNGWGDVERMLEGRKYTVFVGHMHRYKKYVRNGMNYYQLATTGGGSRVRGLRYGEFDQFAWVTMKKDGPVLANVLLDGVHPEDLRTFPSDEEGVAITNRKSVHPVRGLVFLDGCAVPEGMVTFYTVNPDTKKPARVADALLEADGSFVLTTYAANDGAPAGEYVVTVTGAGAAKVPEKYGKPETSDRKATVKAGSNELTLEMKK